MHLADRLAGGIAHLGADQPLRAVALAEVRARLADDRDRVGIDGLGDLAGRVLAPRQEEPEREEV